MGFVKQRFLSMAMVLGIGFLLLVTLLFDAVISAMGDYLGQFVGGEPLMQGLQLVVSFAVITVLFAAIFRILPDLDIAWSDVWVGAALTSLLFSVGKFALGLYLGKAAIGSSYGAAGSLVVLLVWVYWSAQILFLGAEFTQVYARRYGSLQGDKSKQEARARAAKPEDRPRVSESEPRPAFRPAPVAARSAGGGAMKLAAGGLAGMFLGAIAGSLGALIVVGKAARKLLLPFK
jgi:membrane protein